MIQTAQSKVLGVYKLKPTMNFSKSKDIEMELIMEEEEVMAKVCHLKRKRLLILIAMIIPFSLKRL